MRRIHYAWFILLLAFVAIATGTGVRLAFGSFIPHWEHEFGVGRSVTSLIGTISFVVYGLSQPVVGRWADRGGPGGVLAGSMLMVAAGLTLSYFGMNVWMVGAAFGLVASMGFAGVSQVPGSVAVARWFGARRSLALAIVSMASSVGQMTLAPAAIFLNDSLGWRYTVIVYAVGLAVLAPFVYWLLKPSPAAVGMLPYGSEAVEAAPATKMPAADWGGLGQVLKSANFWWLAIPYFVCGITTTGLIDTHLVPFAHDSHLPQASTALAVAVLATFNSAGVMISGYLSDRIPRRYLLAFLYGVRGLTFLFLMTVKSPEALLVFSVVYGLVDFSTVPPTISLSADLFGSNNVGLVYGLVSLSHQIGSALGAFAPGVLRDLTGGYQSSFLAGAGALVVATILSLWLRERPRNEATVAA